MATKAYGASGDAGQTTAGTYTFTVPAGVTSVTATAWGAGGGNASAGGESGVQDAGATWKVRAGGGGKGTTTAGDRVGGTVLVGTGYAGGNGATGGGGGGAGPTGAGGTGGGGTGTGDAGGSAGTGGFAGAGGNGAVFKGDAGSAGAAAGGGGGATSAGAGGGGGACATATFAVTPGDTRTIIVGAGSPSGTYWAGGVGRVQLDYTADLSVNESGTIVVNLLVDLDQIASGPPPWLWWSLSSADGTIFNETGSISVAFGLSGFESWQTVFNESGNATVDSGLTEISNLILVEDTQTVNENGVVFGLETLGYSEAGAVALSTPIIAQDTQNYSEIPIISISSIISSSEPGNYNELGTIDVGSIISGVEGAVVNTGIPSRTKVWGGVRNHTGRGLLGNTRTTTF